MVVRRTKRHLILQAKLMIFDIRDIESNDSGKYARNWPKIKLPLGWPGRRPMLELKTPGLWWGHMYLWSLLKAKYVCQIDRLNPNLKRRREKLAFLKMEITKNYKDDVDMIGRYYANAYWLKIPNIA